jgi:arginyl-tRNA synthetase
MDVRDHLRSALADALTAVGVAGVETAEIELERPGRREHGDWSSNVAMATAKRSSRNPRDLGQELVDHINSHLPAHVTAAELAGPGFVNFRLADSWLHQVLVDVAQAGEDGYARPEVGGARTVNVEFVSANPTGPLHAGHGRWAAYGDSLCRLFERCGCQVHREFYVNDRGTQMELYGASLAARKAGADPPADGYQGQYVTDWATEMPADADPVVWGLERAHRDQVEVLEALHVVFDSWASEKALVNSGAMDAVLSELKQAGHTFEADGAVWLRTTDFGDDKDRVIVRSTGDPTYFLPDIAYHHDKFRRGALVIDILGSDHHGYVRRIGAAMQALGHAPDDYEALIGQNVSVVRDGQEVSLSKRAGTMVETRDLIDLVGPDVARLTYLLQSIDTTQTIDVDVVTAQSSENPVYYVQYAHARVHSVGRQAAERGVERRPLADVDLAVLTHERELDILRSLAELPDVVANATRARSPHQVATWVRELAGVFHRFWHDCPILGADVDDEVRQARLWLVEATRVGLAIGLDLLGVSAPERL